MHTALHQDVFAAADTHVRAMLGWLDQLLAWQTALTRQTYGALADDEYRGLYIPDAEADILSAGPRALPAEFAARHDHLLAQRHLIARRAEQTEQQGVLLPLLHVARLFDLSVFEQNVLVLALAPEVDLRYERLFAFVQDDVTKKRPSVDLALRLLCPIPADQINVRAAFAPDAPLLRHRLIHLFEDGQRQAPLLGRFIKLDERIVAEMLGRSALDPVLNGSVALQHARRVLTDLVLPSALVTRLQHAVAPQPDGVVVALAGGYGSGRGAVAQALCAEHRRPLLRVDLHRLTIGDLPPAEAVERVLREATLTGAAVLWHGADRVLHDEAHEPWRAALLPALDTHMGLSFLPVEQRWEAHGAFAKSRFLCIELPELGYAEREQVWLRRLNGSAPAPRVVQGIASTFRLSGGQIRDAVVMARSLAGWRGGALDADELYAACRAQSSGRLDSLAHKITATYTWDAIVLPGDQIRMLHEICVQVRHRRTVLERWGFDRHLAMGKGLNVLFAGSSGTGKTMAAEIIAADLGLELYKVDLSTMVSKYIGETEKNLDRIFRAAREANAILFFDEADALFGKRSEVKDAHDRYANIEVGYLLQKMEAYDGVVILATNLRKNLDDAFVRRLHLAIDFPFPEEADRLRIWQKVFPAAAPLAGDVDLLFLARQFKLAGGNIRNIALLAAYLAAEEGPAITMRHVIRAVKREYQKLGKLITEAEFGMYLRLAREGI